MAPKIWGYCRAVQAGRNAVVYSHGRSYHNNAIRARAILIAIIASMLVKWLTGARDVDFDVLNAIKIAYKVLVFSKHFVFTNLPVV